MTGYKDFVLSENPVYIGVRFKPGTVAPFLPFPTSEITNMIVPVSEVWRGEDGELLEKLARASSTESCVKVFQRQLIQKVSGLNGRLAPAVGCTLKAIVSTGGWVAVDELSRRLNTSPRNFRRLINSHAGLSPKRLCRILRFRRVLKCLSQIAVPDWADLACQCGYFDQAHMINEFRELSGYTPQAYHSRHNSVGPDLIEQ
jgi:transcriptional regulator GlxA family with amidase domain